MKILEYINMLEYKLKTYFNTQREYEFGGEVFDLKATYIEKNEHYVATKRSVVWDYEQYQHILLKRYDNVDLEVLENFTKILEEFVKKEITPSSSHMSTLVRGIIVTNGDISKEAVKFAKKYKFYKSFKFGLNGWVNVALNLLDINNVENNCYNKRGKEDVDHFTFYS